MSTQPDVWRFYKLTYFPLTVKYSNTILFKLKKKTFSWYNSYLLNTELYLIWSCIVGSLYVMHLGEKFKFLYHSLREPQDFMLIFGITITNLWPNQDKIQY